MTEDFSDQTIWKEGPTYWQHLSPQGTDAWLAARKGRLTASNFGTAVGLNKFCSAEKFAESLVEQKPLHISEKSRTAMALGTEMEPVARAWYENDRNVTVEEIGLVVPKWDPRLGASVDGVIVGTKGGDWKGDDWKGDDWKGDDERREEGDEERSEKRDEERREERDEERSEKGDDWKGDDPLAGIIEIKAPREIYQPLRDHLIRINSGWKPPPFYHKQIWATHYAQIQGCLAILDKKWCDYIVYAVESNLVYVERIYRNDQYWSKVLYPGLQTFFASLPTGSTEAPPEDNIN